MASGYDATEFIDGDFQPVKSPVGGVGGPQRAPTREEVDLRVADAQQKLAELKRAQEELERERAGLEETRRRQREFQTGRQETVQNLARGLVLLEEAEFDARKEAEQLSKAIADMREALTRLEGINEEQWARSSFEVELTRALAALENARMEWNSARLKFPVLARPAAEGGQNGGVAVPAARTEPLPIAGMSFTELCRLGLALTWPLAAVALLVLAVLLVILLRN